MDDTLADLQSIADARTRVQEKAQFGTVLFCDLVGSTRYKELRDEISALSKTYLHNRLATATIIRHRGEVVKYVGDEVMGFFAGEELTANAVQCAIEIQTQLQDLNRRWGLREDDVIRAKVGINSGTVYSFRFPDRPIDDPQGLAVDLAARLASLTKPGQILASGSTCGRLPDQSALSSPVEREIRGLRNRVQIYEVSWGEPALGVAETVHLSEDSADVTAALKFAYEAEASERASEAIRHLQGILLRDPLHFRANQSLAQIHVRYTRRYDQALRYAEVALQSNPLSPRARHARCVIAWYVSPDLPAEELNQLIATEEKVLQEAHEALDYDLEFSVRNTLAYYLAVRHERSGDRKDVDAALAHCEFLRHRTQWLVRYSASAFYHTYGFVMSQEKDIDALQQALEWAQKSRDANPSFPHPHELIGRIQRRLDVLRGEM